LATQNLKRFEYGDQTFDRKSTVAATLQSANITLVRADGARHLRLRQAVSTTQHPQLLAERGHKLAARSVSALDGLHRGPFGDLSHAEKLTRLEPPQDLLAGGASVTVPGILSVASNRHEGTPITADATDDGSERTP